MYGFVIEGPRVVIIFYYLAHVHLTALIPITVHLLVWLTFYQTLQTPTGPNIHPS